MKTLSTTLTSFFVLASIHLAVANAGGFGAGNGGDPSMIDAMPYPDQTGLNKALSYSVRKIQESSYPTFWKTALTTELEQLLKEGKYLMLPAMIFPSTDGKLPCGEIPSKEGRFVSLGGMTQNQKGANVYLAERVGQYALQPLSRLLIHEALHHVLDPLYSEDERFVDNMAYSIAYGVPNEPVRSELGKVSDARLLKALKLEKVLKDSYPVLARLRPGLLLETLPYPETYLDAPNIVNLSAERSIERIVIVVNYAFKPESFDDSGLQLRLRDRLFEVALELDPDNPHALRYFDLKKQGQDFEWRCKGGPAPRNWWEWASPACDDAKSVIRMKDLFPVNLE